MTDGPVQWSIEDGVAVVRLDDGKVNVISHAVVEQLHAALDAAETEARAVAILGREGKLSAGFDLREMTAGPDQARALVRAGGELLMRIFVHPQPVTLAVTGHALAAGALLVLACDTRIGAEGPSKIGLNETAIGMGLPRYAVELARERLATRAFVRAALQAEIFDPDGAVAAGYLDQVVPPSDLEGVAISDARRLGAFRAGAYATTKAQSRQAVIDAVLAGLDGDMANMVPPSAP
jgi:enoyl-CoA hydratase